ncbi:PASTA domain-containing protein [Actinomadura hibisca]|uniref:PASTA domain-containing protein n=1 Tax=Actinomadura hibisca TaxID=68565 RepID=UPI000832211E|nr:PASTA domain-containing protein [Actinomadura hibisca]
MPEQDPQTPGHERPAPGPVPWQGGQPPAGQHEQQGAWRPEDAGRSEEGWRSQETSQPQEAGRPGNPGPSESAWRSGDAGNSQKGWRSEETRAGSTSSAEPAAPDNGNFLEPEMSRRAMLLLGGGASVAVASVLGLTLLIGGTGASPAPRDGGFAASEAPAPASPPAEQPTATASPSASAGPSGTPSPSTSPTAPAATVPQVAGLGSMTAVGRLANRRIPLGALIRVPSSQATGLVLRSHPPAGTPLPPGGAVTLYVSAGQGGAVTGAHVTVPYFLGQTEQQARTSAAGLGLQVTVNGTGGTVTGQGFAPGARLLRGSTVALTLG